MPYARNCAFYGGFYIRSGTAGWSIPGEAKAAFPDAGTHLQRYAGVFGAVEINSSFHRPHRLSTYRKWAASVPESFRFAVKVPKEITHVRKLSEVEPQIDGFLADCAGLGNKLGPLLVQLPPSLAFNPAVAEGFFAAMQDRVTGAIACEPRHASWFTPEAEALLVAFRVGRVGADPAKVPHRAEPGGWQGLTYLRLHGAPRVYYSSYSEQAIQAAMDKLCLRAAEGSECWCIFDNTASGAATENALFAKAGLDTAV